MITKSSMCRSPLAALLLFVMPIAFAGNPISINLHAGELHLVLRCSFDKTWRTEAFIARKRGQVMTIDEVDVYSNRLTQALQSQPERPFKSEFALVAQNIDGNLKNAPWEIDLSGGTVTPPDEALLIDRLRGASFFRVTVLYKQRRYEGLLQ